MIIYLALLLPFIILYFLIGFNPYRLFQNYLLARTTNFALIITPPNPQNILWIIFGVPLRPHLLRLLPPWLSHRLALTTYGNEFSLRNTVHSAHGKSFIVVSSGNNELNVADPALAWEILRRPKEFRQTLIGSHVMRIFGDNLITSDGEHWARQRKLIASNINERISEGVYEESRRQAKEMVARWTSSAKGDADIKRGESGKIEGDSNGETNTYAEALKSLAINVLGLAGYGVQTSFADSQLPQKPKPGFKLTYIEATRMAVDHIVEASLFPAWVFLLGFMPQSVKRLGYAIQEFRGHTEEMLEQERQEIRNGGRQGKVNLMGMLVRESDGLKGAKTITGQEVEEKTIGGVGLTEDEIMGNLFVFTAAGFDTTANSMAYAMTLLAVHPEWQDWLCEELDEVVWGRSEEEMEYTEVYPRLVRCLAVMYETLRLFPPVVHIAKGTSQTISSPITLIHPITGTIHKIPANTTIYVNAVGVAHDEEIWGKDVGEFKPTRFIDYVGLDGVKGGGGGDERHHEDNNREGGKKEGTSIKSLPKGSYLPWSAGPRVCPGMKMSQVEFVTVFMTVFSKYRVEIVRKGKKDGKKKGGKMRGQGGGDGEGELESVEEARKRVEGIMADSQSRLTLQMNRPGDVWLRFVRREGR